MSDTPLSVAQVRAVDRHAIDVLHIPGIVLMENAGRGCAERILALPRRADGRFAILCGSGNNGGDGFVIARHLALAGAAVEIVLAVSPEKLAGDAAVNWLIASRMSLPMTRADIDPQPAQRRIAEAEVIVDALLGTGSRGAPRGVIATLIDAANVACGRRVAIDIPSGLDADTGEVYQPCVRAMLTITMVAPKIGFSQPAAREVLGEVVVVGIGAPSDSAALR